MQFNILDMFKDAVGDQLVDQASGFLGESKEGTTKAIGALLPGLLGGLVNKGSSEAGAQGILDFLGKNDMGGGLLDNLGGLFTGGEATTNLMNSGGGILDFIFGGGSSATGKIIDAVTSMAGLKRGSTSSLLRMAAPLLMGVIGKHVKSKALGALGLKNLLGSQVPTLQKLAPAGLFDKIGIGSALSGIASGLGNIGGKVTDAAGNVVETGAETVKKAGAMAGAAAAGAAAVGSKAAKAGAKTVSAAANAGKSGISKILPWLLLVAAAIALFAIMRSCNGQGGVVDNMKDATENMADKASDAASGAADMVKDAAEGAADMAKDAAGGVMDAAAQAGSVLAGLGQKALDAAKALGKTVTDGIASFTLPGGKKISTPEGSNAEAFLTFLAADGDDLGTRFTLDRVNFETGSANITAESNEQISNFASILEAYPSVNIRLEGHTDNTGNAEANKTLSTQRALAVKSALAQMGIGSDRMESQGFGQENPVADNETPEGRAINRRVDVYVTKK